MNIAYIIGPYRAETIWGIRQNIIVAERVGAEVAEFGIFPYIPHKNTAFFDGVAPDELWLNGNLELIRRGVFDLAVVCSGSERSDGSIAEKKEFRKLNIPILYREQAAFWLRLDDFFNDRYAPKWVEAYE